jgi:hypothetical protein
MLVAGNSSAVFAVFVYGDTQDHVASLYHVVEQKLSHHFTAKVLVIEQVGHQDGADYDVYIALQNEELNLSIAAFNEDFNANIEFMSMIVSQERDLLGRFWPAVETHEAGGHEDRFNQPLSCFER